MALDDMWRMEAACQDEDPELFFPIAETGSANERQIAQAKAVCARCPVRSTCLDVAFDERLVGVWGGTTERERRAALPVRLAKQKAASETAAVTA